MDAATALQLVNDELSKYGQPPLDISEEQAQRAYASLRGYMAQTGRPIHVAVADTVKFHIQSKQLMAQQVN